MQISDLGDMLSSDDPAERRQAAELLSQNTETAGGLAVELVRHAGDDDRVVAEYCVATLEELGEPTTEQVQPLADLATSGNADVAYWAATLLGRAGEAAAGQATLLGNIVASEAPPQVRQRAAWALGRMGPAAAAATAQLEACRDVQPSGLARAVAAALESIRG